ncbi:hypothetical protein ASPFODRAFT_41742 [Aspergillus luchuensis CBS 106.47]|uniref:Uncharacterized protein n=1 Tax=Aspergillus luchuensis (strain CBS 106.47) TaxID=1137211 RepID=A0A1M3TWV5_ASPLC|nr:hypothetical protein ASPFODRAFT_41742 [Aspergillus luchuensis CBS 106.47]
MGFDITLPVCVILPSHPASLCTILSPIPSLLPFLPPNTFSPLYPFISRSCGFLCIYYYCLGSPRPSNTHPDL